MPILLKSDNYVKKILNKYKPSLFANFYLYTYTVIYALEIYILYKIALLPTSISCTNASWHICLFVIVGPNHNQVFVDVYQTTKRCLLVLIYRFKFTYIKKYSWYLKKNLVSIKQVCALIAHDYFISTETKVMKYKNNNITFIYSSILDKYIIYQYNYNINLAC